MARAWMLAIAMWACGCALSHERDAGGGRSERDGASPDADLGHDCPVIGGYRGCGALCAAPCPERWQCVEYLQVCLPRPSMVPVEDHRGEIPVCAFSARRSATSGPAERYCWDGTVCAIDPSTFDRVSWANRCVPVEYCREAPEHGIDAPCYYSDHTWFVTGPPAVDACPAPADPLTPFCGGPCGDCPFHVVSGGTGPPQLDYDISCVGISERRGVGVCTFGLKWGCRRDARMGLECEGAYGRPCAFMMLRGEDGEELERGWITFESSCLAYRAFDPEGVVCRSPHTWDALGE